MKYENMKEGRFLSRPNRFIAHVELEGQEVVCHVKNTGRCKELLIPGETKVWIQDHGENTTRKTRYSLINVVKNTSHGNMMINMDSQAPNKVAKEWLENGGFGKEVTFIKSEKTYGDSRFDLYFEYVGEDEKIVKAYMEVKGVTLEEDGEVRFPDAPTSRGTKHIEGLMKAKKNGYDAYILFVVQLETFHSFAANAATDPAFAMALSKAKKQGVHILVKGCHVTKDTLEIIR
ncbi:sugar/maltose fermentation stimulation protein homolog [Lachnospiraceae bacterium KM106-2]|nr:sugar/maltose fermentation stimulation protein homolog [Lachnospiraceae bacterium KM106-2]